MGGSFHQKMLRPLLTRQLSSLVTWELESKGVLGENELDNKKDPRNGGEQRPIKEEGEVEANSDNEKDQAENKEADDAFLVVNPQAQNPASSK